MLSPDSSQWLKLIKHKILFPLPHPTTTPHLNKEMYKTSSFQHLIAMDVMCSIFFLSSSTLQSLCLVSRSSSSSSSSSVCPRPPQKNEKREKKGEKKKKTSKKTSQASSPANAFYFVFVLVWNLGVFSYSNRIFHDWQNLHTDHITST